MKLTDRVQNNIVVLEPKGKIMGGPDASLLHDKLYECIESDRKKVVIDLAGVEWMNSTGLGILISGYTTLKNADGTLKLVGVNKRIDQIFMVTKLHTIFEAFEEEASALASF